MTPSDRNHRMELQYDGTGLHGWARQEGLPTVQGCLEAAFLTALGHIPALRVAGRTDAGVHARRQVVSLWLPADIDLVRLVRSLNALTPPGISVFQLSAAPEAFDARGDATSRTYRYFVCVGPTISPFWAPYCWQVKEGLDLKYLRDAAAAVLGRHDFTAFTPTESEHVYFERQVSLCRWRRVSTESLAALPAAGNAPGGVGLKRRGQARGGVIYLEIEAEAFLRHMVRTLVGTMVEVARGSRTLADLETLLRGASRKAAGPTAPPCGLFLWDVRY